MSKTYGGEVPVYALEATNLSIYAGDQLAIIGPSGSGKSTLLNLLGMIDSSSSGSYLLDGVELSDANELIRGSVRGQLFGFVFQSFHLLPGRTLLENVELGMVYLRIPPKLRRTRSNEALERLGLGHRRNADPRHLSGGERQRAAIARALTVNPKILFCDEPTGNLDTKNTEVVMNLLKQLNDEGLTTVLVTHDNSIAEQMNRRISVRDGRVTESEVSRNG